MVAFSCAESAFVHYRKLWGAVPGTGKRQKKTPRREGAKVREGKAMVGEETAIMIGGTHVQNYATSGVDPDCGRRCG
jgi:hypothetical protein